MAHAPDEPTVNAAEIRAVCNVLPGCQPGLATQIVLAVKAASLADSRRVAEQLAGALRLIRNRADLQPGDDPRRECAHIHAQARAALATYATGAAMTTATPATPQQSGETNLGTP